MLLSPPLFFFAFAVHAARAFCSHPAPPKTASWYANDTGALLTPYARRRPPPSGFLRYVRFAAALAASARAQASAARERTNAAMV